MNLQQFASDPSDPLWEEPHYRDQHTITVDCDGVQGRYIPDTESSRAKVLHDEASELNRLCATNAPFDDIKAFLSKWECDDPSSPEVRRVQSNALAWFSDTNAVQLA